jgi:hypothetical protein
MKRKPGNGLGNIFDGMNKTETPYLKIWMEDQVIHCAFKGPVDIDIQMARVCVFARIEFSHCTSYPCLLDMTRVRSATREAREYMAKEGCLFITAGALIVHSPLSKMIGNMFLSLNRPRVPARLFSSKMKAKEWLRSYPAVEAHSTLAHYGNV